MVSDGVGRPGAPAVKSVDAWRAALPDRLQLTYHGDQANFVLLTFQTILRVPVPMHQEVFAEARALRLQLIESSEKAFLDLLDRFPIARYLDMLAPGNGFGGYGTVSEQAAAQCSQLVGIAGEQGMDRYHRIAILDSIARFPDLPSPLVRPASVLRQAAVEFRRMVRQANTARPGFFLIGNDLFDKDLAICRGKLMPCGAQLVDVRSGVPRSVITRGGPAEATRVLRFFGLHARGYRPFLEMHLDPRALSEFSPEGWDRCYLRIAEILRANPELKGVFGSSWWFDPEVGRLTPDMAYPLERPLAHGAANFRIGPDSATTSNAIRFSKVRKELFDRGEYTPTIYLMAWRSQDVIRYADRLRAAGMEC